MEYIKIILTQLFGIRNQHSIFQKRLIWFCASGGIRKMKETRW